MRILNLQLKNIGPFLEGNIDFIKEEDNMKKPPVTIITGENGTGKTIILDAIRALLYGDLNDIERDIERDKHRFEIKAQFYENELLLVRINPDFYRETKYNAVLSLNKKFDKHNIKPDSSWNWVIQYWTSKASTDRFAIDKFLSPDVKRLYADALTGVHQNVEVTHLICFFDYLRSSDNPKEKKVGEKLFEILRTIINISLTEGEFKYVERATFTPIVSQMGQEISLDKLSSGNLYLIQRMVSMLGKMYMVNQLNNEPLENLCQTPGILMIDEAENHLHPKWQKTFINSILEIFPNLQIIVTTHSPFIVSSVENARIYVCQSKGDHAIISDETDLYANKPIEEILLSPLFGGTYPFNTKITDLMIERKKAIDSRNTSKKEEIEAELQEINPNYFSYLNIDRLLEELTAK